MSFIDIVARVGGIMLLVGLLLSFCSPKVRNKNNRDTNYGIMEIIAFALIALGFVLSVIGLIFK